MTDDAPKSAQVAMLIGNVELLRRAVDRLNQRLRIWKLVGLLSIIGLVLDLSLSGAFGYLFSQQGCQNQVNHKFFAAELDKVRGQIVAEDVKIHGFQVELRGLTQGPKLAPITSGLQEVIGGTREWIAKTNHYIAEIDSIKEHC